MKLLVVGCGSIGERHIQNLVQLGAGEIVACDLKEDILERMEEKYGVKTSSNLEESLGEKPDAVLVCTHSDSHLPIAISAAKSGAHVFIEKPLAEEIDGVNELIEITKEKTLALMVGFNLRFNSSLQRIKKLLEEGRIGKIVSARAHFGSYLPDRHRGGDYKEEYVTTSGVVLDGIHDIDYISWLMGMPREIFCYSEKISGLEMEAEDNADILMRFDTKAVASIHMDCVQRPYQRFCELIGEKGTVRWELMLDYDVKSGRYSFNSDRIRIYDIETGKWQTIEGDKDLNEMYVREMEHFIACVRGEKSPPVDGKREKLVLELALAARESAKTGKVVELK